MPRWWSSYFVDMIVVTSAGGGEGFGGEEEEVAFMEYGGKSPLAGLASCYVFDGNG